MTILAISAGESSLEVARHSADIYISNSGWTG